jgi:hypothetical protein
MSSQQQQAANKATEAAQSVRARAAVHACIRRASRCSAAARARQRLRKFARALGAFLAARARATSLPTNADAPRAPTI